MIFRAPHRFTLITLLSLAIGCADDGGSDDDVADETESTGTESTSESGSESESGSTDDETGSTDDEADATSESTESTDAETTDTETTDTETTDAETTDTETTDTETTDTETTDTETTADTGEEIMCPDVFPMFDKSCSGDNDCAVVVHTTDCCGNSVAIGINENEVDAFEAAEAICDSQYPPCGCPAGPTVAEDGNQAFDPNDLDVECVMGACTSFVP
jgi:hypothetical protein